MKKDALFMLSEMTTMPSQQVSLAESVDFYSKPENENRPLKFKIPLMEAESRNGNNRVYAFNSIKGGMKGYEKLINSNQAFMEQSHPVTTNVQRFSTFMLKNCVAKLNSYSINGNQFDGVVETLMNTAGKDMKNIILYNQVPIGTSVRALGSAKMQGGVSRISENLKILGYDLVLNPSFNNSVVSSIITESEISDLIAHSSDNLKILQEALNQDMGEEIEIVSARSKIQYDITENVAIVCTDGQCLKVFLEDHIKDEVTHSFGSFFGNKF